MYDLAIIGAGINGASVAYEFTKAGKKIVIFDMNGIAGGGSGAAGAFIAPKFSKKGELKELIHDAFVYSMEFYEKNFPHFFKKTDLLHIAKDEKSSQMLKNYKQDNSLTLKELPKEFLDSLESHAREFEQISIDAGVVDARAMCRAMVERAKFVEQKVDDLVYNDGMWVINESYSAKSVLLATGAYEAVVKEPYIKINGIWGHRIDVKTSTFNPYNIHQNVSISPSSDGVLAIGATHNLEYHPQTATKAYDVESGRAELLKNANKSIKLEDVQVIKDFMGLRSSSVDYMPLLGSLVISKETLLVKNIRYKVQTSNFDEYSYYPNLYMINGNGGYGFVLAPYLAKMLSEHIFSDREISERLSPKRFFTRCVKRL